MTQFRPVLFAALLTAGMALPATAIADDTDSEATQPWSKQARATQYGGVVVGNPDAATKLIEFISYTCPHCAHYAGEAEAEIDHGFIDKGTVSVEVRPYLLNAVDFAGSLMAGCGGPEAYMANHNAILAAQPQWLGKIRTIPAERQEQWYATTPQQGLAMLIADSGLDQVMLDRGFTAEQITACAADMTRFRQIGEGTQNAKQQYLVSATPSFAVQGQLLPNVHSWEGVRAALVAATNPES